MADTPEPKGGGGGTFGFLGKKVFGKVPIWVIAVGAVGGYYWYAHYGPGKKTAGQQQQQTDPAGNVCAQINQDTGYCPGSVEDTAALQAQAAASDGTGSATSGATGPTGPEGPPGPQGPPGPPPVIPGPGPCPPGTHRKLIGGPCVPIPRPKPPPPRGTGGGGPGPPPPPPRPRRRPAPKRWPTPRPRVPVGPGGGPVPPPVRVYAPGTTGSVYASTG